MRKGERKPCPQCGAVVPDSTGPVHAYVPSSAGCWTTFGAVQAAGMQRFGHAPTHGLVVDAYMAQHPGDGVDRRERQSVFLHLVALCAALEEALAPQYRNDLLRLLLREHRYFPALRRSSGPGEVTVAHLLGARDPADYDRRARAWADSVWLAWSEHHVLVRETLARVTGSSPGRDR